MEFRYIVKKEEGFIKAIAKKFKTIEEEIWDDQSMRDAYELVVNRNDYVHPEEIGASTKCVSPDTYDETVGKDIAESKVALKYHKMMSSDYKKLIKKLKFLLSKAEEKLEYHEKKAEKISDNLNDRYYPPKNM